MQEIPEENIVGSKTLTRRTTTGTPRDVLSPLGWLFSWAATPVFVSCFFSILVLFHPFIALASRISSGAFRWVFNLMNRALLLNLRIAAGMKFEVEGSINDLPSSVPIIVISNHQSMFDIPMLIVALRRYHPVFVSKRELAKGIPSISLSLREMGAAIIDRGDPAQAISAIEELGVRTAMRPAAVCIFPEGTRARDGRMKPFKFGGCMALQRTMPQAVVLPIALSGSWELLRWNLRPIPFGTRVKMKILPPLATTADGALEEAEAQIREWVAAEQATLAARNLS